jgi:hypothetical protein
MAIQGRDERGVSVVLGDPVLMPYGVEQYQSGPVTYRHLIIGGTHWLGIFEAKHDGVGWFVVRTSRRPLVLMPGDHINIRVRVVEDHGNAVVVEFNDPNRGRSERAIARQDIVFIEERPGPITTEQNR